MEETLDRLGAFSGWEKLPNWNACRAKYNNTKTNAASEKYQSVEKDTKAWHHIAKKNQFDLDLFEHAQTIFQMQQMDP